MGLEPNVLVDWIVNVSQILNHLLLKSLSSRIAAQHRWSEKESRAAATPYTSKGLCLSPREVVHHQTSRLLWTKLCSTRALLDFQFLLFSSLDEFFSAKMDANIAPRRIYIDGGVCRIIIFIFKFFTSWDLGNLLAEEGRRFWWRLHMHTTNHIKQFYSTKRLPRTWNLPRRNSTPGVLNQIEIKIIFISTKRV